MNRDDLLHAEPAAVAGHLLAAVRTPGLEEVNRALVNALTRIATLERTLDVLLALLDDPSRVVAALLPRIAAVEEGPGVVTFDDEIRSEIPGGRPDLGIDPRD